MTFTNLNFPFLAYFWYIFTVNLSEFLGYTLKTLKQGRGVVSTFQFKSAGDKRGKTFNRRWGGLVFTFYGLSLLYFLGYGQFLLSTFILELGLYFALCSMALISAYLIYQQTKNLTSSFEPKRVAQTRSQE